MSRRFLIVGSICAALGVSAAPSGAARYALVDDGWGYDCYGSYERGATMVVPLSGGSAVLSGLPAELGRTIQFVDGGRGIAWSDATGVRVADLRAGRAVLLGRLARNGPGFFAVDRRGHTALLADGSRARLVLVRVRRGHVARRVVADADGVAAGLSADGRYVAYSGSKGIGVRAVAGGPATWVGSAATWWEVAGDRLGYLDAGGLHVLDMRTGVALVDAPVGPSADGPLGGPSWSPDGGYILLGDGTVVDVGARVTRALPAFATEEASWRPGRDHQLLRSSSADSDLVDARTGAELWRRAAFTYLSWSPDGRWLLNRDGPPDLLLNHDGAVVSLPGSVRPPVDWLGADMLASVDERTLRVAAPPRWRPRVLTRGARGHHLTATAIFTASRAGLRLLAKTFAPGAHARDCR